MAPSLFPKTKPSFCQNLKYICQKYRVKMCWSKSKQPKAQRSQWWVSFTRVENYRTNNQFCCLGRYRAWAYLATRSWWPALRAGAYQINQQTIIVFLFAVVVVINLDDGVCRSLLIVIAVSGTMFKPVSLAARTFVWQLGTLFGSLNVIERQGRETFVVKRFFPESQVQELWAARLIVGYTFVVYQIQKKKMITDT